MNGENERKRKAKKKLNDAFKYCFKCLRLTNGKISNGKISSGPPVVKCKSDINSVLMNGRAMAKAWFTNHAA